MRVTIPDVLADEIRRIATKRDKTVDEIFRDMIRVGLIAHYVSERSDATLIIRDAEGEREVEV
jgi:hypothetical protein